MGGTDSVQERRHGQQKAEEAEPELDDEVVMEIANGDNMLLKNIITANYGMSDEWMTNMVAILYGCTMWRAIRNLWPLKLSGTRIKVGNGFRSHLEFGMTSG